MEKETLRIKALELAVDLSRERHGDGNMLNSPQIIADATIFYRFLTKIPKGFAPASG